MSVPPRPLLEVCVESVAGLAAAASGGADRVELCTGLVVGGLTPPASLVQTAARQHLPVHLLARPREGDFNYGPAEQALVADDIRLAAEAGLTGIVIGASMVDRRLDAGVLSEWIVHARTLGAERGWPLSTTLHRAFDLAPDLDEALETAVALGFDRILTSGGAPRAIEGVAKLTSLHRQAAGRINVLAGSGVSTETVAAILATGVGEVHASCRTATPVASDVPERRFGFVGRETGVTDVTKIAALARALQNYGVDNTNVGLAS